MRTHQLQATFLFFTILAAPPCQSERAAPFDAAHAATVSPVAAQVALQNRFVRRVLEKQGDAWGTTAFSRSTGKDVVRVQSDEVLIRLMDGKELTVADYRAVADPVLRKDAAGQSLLIRYLPARDLSAGAPLEVAVTYTLANEPYFRKRLILSMPSLERMQESSTPTSSSISTGKNSFRFLFMVKIPGRLAS